MPIQFRTHPSATDLVAQMLFVTLPCGETVCVDVDDRGRLLVETQGQTTAYLHIMGRGTVAVEVR